jgi:hypothetical protein
MEAAIQWLPVIGGSVCLSIAINAWFTADRQLVAVWFGFAGLCALLLTAALQLHLYVTTSILQPKIELGSLGSPSHFKWDSIRALPTLKASNDQSLLGESIPPVFSVSNSSPVLAADLSIEWVAPPLDVNYLSTNYPQFTQYIRNVRAGPYEFILRGGPDGDLDLPRTVNAREKSRVSIPFLNRPAETSLPIEVWWRAMPLVISKLSMRPGSDEFEVEFGVTVSWNIPDRGTPQKFVLVAHVRNTKQERERAMMDAEITWLFRRTSG